MVNDNVIKAFKMLAEDILRLFQTVLESDVGINRKIGENTLKDSRLAKTAQVSFNVPFIKLMVNDYIDDIENGRPKKAQLVPIQDLLEWASRKGIPTDNHTLEIIQYVIWKDGIKGRPVMRTFYKLLDKEWNEVYSHIIFEGIMEELIKTFNER